MLLIVHNHGTLEAAQRSAGHADSRTTKLSGRRGQRVFLEDIGADSVLNARKENGGDFGYLPGRVIAFQDQVIKIVGNCDREEPR